MAVSFCLLFPLLRAFRKCLRVLCCISVQELHLSTLTVNGISYYNLHEGGKVTTLSSLKIVLHIPTLDSPYFASIYAKGFRHFGPLASGYCTTLLLRVRLPRRNQTWFRVRIDDLQASARRSVPPYFLDRLRKDILRTIVLGRIVHLDDFHLDVDTSMLWAGKGVSARAAAVGYRVAIQERTYDFKDINVILHRLWDQNHGRLAITTDGVTWYKTDVDETRGQERLRFRDFIFYPSTIIASIWAAFKKPASLFDLELTSGQLKFPRFRHRDQPILKHAMQLSGETNPHIMRSGFAEQLMWDTIGGILEMFNAHIDTDSELESGDEDGDEDDDIPTLISE